ncbi:spermatogenesis-associated protein 5 [Trichogramma pretiosum]|uniref:spermatogenesis-associated protein 5 n=1 Tax=Trichogramma pretiosum TaxID=7493 RepID=UPI0006C98F72|nr:spermatogenesis-associated protein 5 [Trichogramma pretiosum]
MPTPRKSLWTKCDNCQACLSEKDKAAHEKSCPPTEASNHNFIRGDVLYCKIGACEDAELSLPGSGQESDRFIFLPQLRKDYMILNIVRGDPVIINTSDNAIVKIAHPSNNKNLSALLTKDAIELDKMRGSVSIKKLDYKPSLAQEIVIKVIGKTQVDSNETSKIKLDISRSYHRHILTSGNRIRISYNNQKLIFEVVNIKSNDSIEEEFEKLSIESENRRKFYLVQIQTNWRFFNEESEQKIIKKNLFSLKHIGGYSDLIKDLIKILKIGLKSDLNLFKFKISKGILLHGPPGVGKSMLVEALLSEFDAHVIRINPLILSTCNKNETDSILKNLFDQAFEKPQSIVFIDDIDILCPNKNNLTSYEKKVFSNVVTFFDELQLNKKNIVVLAVSSDPESINTSLKNPKFFGKEFHMPIPTRDVRKQIILKMIETIPNSLTENDIDKIAYETHGFVGADLTNLCSEACLKALSHESSSKTGGNFEVLVSKEDFIHARNVVNPMEMKEIAIQNPNVKWSDIGGQNDLKKKLLQSIEWPIKYPELFSGGLRPPRGVLMFGPPGCSKTMIAKALATESKLNFLNVKGPELFSKFVGQSEKKVRKLFKTARQVAPCIIFIDEIDALGGERSTSSEAGGCSVQERVLTQLLTELDGVVALRNVTLVAATNRPDRIDKALLRPGRFDRLIYVPLPDAQAREEIFKIKLAKMLTSSIKIEELVKKTEGYSGAEIGAVCNEVGLKAINELLINNPETTDFDESLKITMEDFDKALETVLPRTDVNMLNMYDKYVRRSI